MDKPVLPPDIQALLSHPLPGHLIERRTAYLSEYTHAVAEIRERYVRAFGELVLREMEYLVCCGWGKEASYLPAINNLGERKREMQEELITEIGRLQGELRRRLDRLWEEVED